MNYGEIKFNDVANGQGIRVCLFVSGCSHRCTGCFNKETWDFNYGKPYTQYVEDSILKELEKPYIAGLTILGGEPMEKLNQQGLINLLKTAKKIFPQKNIWLYTGYTLETDLLQPSKISTPYTTEILSLVDVLIDGKFIEEQKNLTLNFRGSANQRIIDLPQTLNKNKTILHPLNNIV